MNVLRSGDQHGWAYAFIAQEHARYSSHNITYAKHDQVKLDGIDILYIHSPDITNYHATNLPLEAKEKGIKVIGAYAGNPTYWTPAEKKTYSYADLIVTISPETYSFANFHMNYPTIYLPECVDHNFFTPKKFNKNGCIIGWAGGMHKKIKRGYILKQLDYPVLIKDSWKKQREEQNKQLTLEQMRDFYKSIDILLVTSESECQPRVILEAMATGIPVISTDVGSVATLIESEWLVPTRPDTSTINAINKRLNILTKYPCVRKKVGERNREHIEKYFSWSIRQNIWDGVFENLMLGKFDEIKKLSQLTLIPYKKEFYSRLVKWNNFSYVAPVSSKTNIKTWNDLVASLITNVPFKFWLEKTSCAEAILFQKLNKTDTLYLGVQNSADYQCLINVLQKLNYDKSLKVKILENPTIKTTKPMPFYEWVIQVPLPVIPYLTSEYGKEWENNYDK